MTHRGRQMVRIGEYFHVLPVLSRGKDRGLSERGTVMHEGRRIPVMRGNWFWVQDGEPWPKHGFINKEIR